MTTDGPSDERSVGKRPSSSRRYRAHLRANVEPTPDIVPREVYFVLARRMKMLKIGRAHNARERLADLQIGSPDKLELLGVIVCERGGKLESELHKRFAHLWSHGEWFRATAGLLNYVSKHAAEPLAKGGRHVSAATRQWDEAMAKWRASV